jgi:hypothetical protein
MQARACAFGNIDPHLACYSTDPFASLPPAIRIVRIAETPEESQAEPHVQIDLERAQRCAIVLLWVLSALGIRVCAVHTASLCIRLFAGRVCVAVPWHGRAAGECSCMVSPALAGLAETVVSCLSTPRLRHVWPSHTH